VEANRTVRTVRSARAAIPLCMSDLLGGGFS